jgi:hypothetical protein
MILKKFNSYFENIIRMKLVIEKPTLDKLLEFMNSKVEVGGNFKYNDGYLTLGPIYTGDRFHVVFDQTVSAFNFHTHPTESAILFSFYSRGDIVAGLRRQSLSNKIRKDILVTEDGVYSLQISPKLMSLYKRNPGKIEFLLGVYQRLIVQQKMNPFGDGVEIVDKNIKDSERIKYACNIVDMVDLLNSLTGEKLFNWMIDEIEGGRLSFKDKLELASYVNLEKQLVRVGPIFYVYFMPWGKEKFEDAFVLFK